jgi:peptide/nickel transport system permease protein
VSVVAQTRAASAAVRRRRSSTPWLLIFCLAILGAVLVMAIFGPLLEPDNPLAQNLVTGMSTPHAGHLLGTDSLGRDVLSRIIAGSWRALFGPLLISIGSAVIGNLLGLWAGYKGGRVDNIVMRWVDLMWALPSLLVIIVTQSAIGGGYWLAVGLLLVLTIPFDTRVIRGATMEQMPRPYVEAAKSLGVSDWRIMVQHIWPNVAAVAVANACLVFAASLVALASLAFLGLGVTPQTPDWGVMVSDGESLLFANPVADLAPALMIVVTAAAMNLLGDWAYDYLSARGSSR